MKSKIKRFSRGRVANKGGLRKEAKELGRTPRRLSGYKGKKRNSLE